jgi:uncharacterized membrane protein YkoI
MKIILAFAGAALAASVAAAQPAPPSPLIGITRAVAAAERAAPGRALEAELDTHKGKMVYSVEVVSKDTLHEVLIDARTGTPISTTPRKGKTLWHSWLRSDWKVTSKLNGPLAPRLAALEKQSGGRVQEVDYDVENGVPIYEVDLVAPAGATEVQLDARSGDRLAMYAD